MATASNVFYFANTGTKKIENANIKKRISNIRVSHQPSGIEESVKGNQDNAVSNIKGGRTTATVWHMRVVAQSKPKDNPKPV